MKHPSALDNGGDHDQVGHRDNTFDDDLAEDVNARIDGDASSVE